VRDTSGICRLPCAVAVMFITTVTRCAVLACDDGSKFSSVTFGPNELFKNAIPINGLLQFGDLKTKGTGDFAIQFNSTRAISKTRGHSNFTSLILTVRPCKVLKVMYVRGVQTCFGGFWGKTSYRDVR
jgi:hypothetical protein